MLFRRPGGIYNFRRSVPPNLRASIGKTEFVATLNTATLTLARARAGRLYEVTETMFRAARAMRPMPTPEELGDLDRTDDNLQAVMEGALEGAQAIIESQQKIIEMERRRFELEAATIRLTSAQDLAQATAILPQASDLLARLVDRIQTDRGRISEARESRSEARQMVEMLSVAIANLSTGQKASTSPTATTSPLFSEMGAAFLTARHDYTQQTRAQAGATLRLWVEIMGDKPVRSFAGTDAGRFLDVIRRLPASHGKARGTPQTAPDAVAAADIAQASGRLVPRLTEKTVKRHASTLSQLWVYMQPLDHVEKNIFQGFRFPGTKASKSKQSDWSAESLAKLLAQPWKSKAISTQTYRWIVTIGMYSGMRLEEICRLRPGLDIVRVEGQWVFLVQEHPDGWSPKSEAGERAVPVHPALTRAGFLHLHAKMERAGAARIFHDLTPGGPGGGLGYEFSRQFSKHKVTAGVPADTVFHSFRHSVSTILRNTDAAIRSEWIDAVLGHEGGQRSQGATTYLKRIGVKNLTRTIRAIEYPGDIDISCTFDTTCVETNQS